MYCIRVTRTIWVGGRGVATAGIIPTTHASFLREPGGGRIHFVLQDEVSTLVDTNLPLTLTLTKPAIPTNTILVSAKLYSSQNFSYVTLIIPLNQASLGYVGCEMVKVCTMNLQTKKIYIYIT